MEMYKGVEVKSRNEMFRMKATGSAEELVKLLSECNNNGKEVLYRVSIETRLEGVNRITKTPNELIFYTESTKDERARMAIARYKEIIGEIEKELVPDLFDIEVRYEIVDDTCRGKVDYMSLYEQLNIPHVSYPEFIEGAVAEMLKKENGSSSDAVKKAE